MLCEKPLGRTAEESYEIWRRVAARRDAHVRVQLPLRSCDQACARARRGRRARRAPPLSGCLPEGLRASALPRTTWKYDRTAAGSGALGDLASHAVDLARYLAGEIVAVSAVVRTLMPDRDVDDCVEAVVELDSGAVGTLEATRLALGGETRSASSSTARRARSRSTSSG